VRDDISTASDEEANDDASENADNQTREDTSDDGPDSHTLDGEVVSENPCDSSDQHSRENAPESSSNCSIEQYGDVHTDHPAEFGHEVPPLRFAGPWSYPSNSVLTGRRESVIASWAPNGSL
jgi:hypothetical protein